MTTYEIYVNAKMVATVKAANRDAAINRWLVNRYGSTMSSSAPYNVSASKQH